VLTSALMVTLAHRLTLGPYALTVALFRAGLPLYTSVALLCLVYDCLCGSTHLCAYPHIIPARTHNSRTVRHKADHLGAIPVLDNYERTQKRPFLDIPLIIVKGL